MIVGSLLLILVAVTLLVLGLANGSSVLLISSIAASLLAAVALVVGARQAAAARAGSAPGEAGSGQRLGDEDDREPRYRHGAATAHVAEPVDRRDSAGWTMGDASVAVAEPEAPPRPEPHRGPDGHTDESTLPFDESVDGDLADEPAEQYVSAAQAARIARLTSDVLVVDGRPRYHLASCAFLRGHEGEPLPVGEAVELGFTPCGLCEPVSALAADARHG